MFLTGVLDHLQILNLTLQRKKKHIIILIQAMSNFKAKLRVNIVKDKMFKVKKKLN